MCYSTTPYHTACGHYGSPCIALCIRATSQRGRAKGCDHVVDQGVFNPTEESGVSLCLKCRREKAADIFFRGVRSLSPVRRANTIPAATPVSIFSEWGSESASEWRTSENGTSPSEASFASSGPWSSAAPTYASEWGSESASKWRPSENGTSPSEASSPISTASWSSAASIAGSQTSYSNAAADDEDADSTTSSTSTGWSFHKGKKNLHWRSFNGQCEPSPRRKAIDAMYAKPMPLQTSNKFGDGGVLRSCME